VRRHKFRDAAGHASSILTVTTAAAAPIANEIAECFGSAVELLRLVGSGGLLLRELAIATLDLFRRDVLDMGANPPLIA